MDITYVEPTRQCFDDAMQLLAEIIASDQPLDDVYVVHALITSNEPGKEGDPISHGWLEYRDHVFFRGIVKGERMDLAAPRREYYKHAGLIELIRYTPDEVAELNERTGLSGPWDDLYLRHTRQGKMKYEQQQSQSQARNY